MNPPSTNRPPLVDGFGRVHDRLRVSVTDRCNLRCTYCMPATGAVFKPRRELLTFEEITRVTSVLVNCGVRRVRLTGGEPLVRADLPVLVEQLTSLPGLENVGLTTNGLRLEELAEPLRRAGATHLNISLDALDDDTFEAVTRRTGLDRVLRGIEVAQRVDFPSIKLNAVSMRGVTESQLLPFGRFARGTGLEVRFIEYMPLDADRAWQHDRVFAGEEILEQLADAFGPLEPIAASKPAPATRYRFADGKGTIGIIPSVSEPFCASCNRFRLTADGRFRACLFSLEETDVRDRLRRGCDDQAIEQAARDCLASKWAGHHINLDDFRQPARPMYSIGG